MEAQCTWYKLKPVTSLAAEVDKGCWGLVHGDEEWIQVVQG